VVAQTGRTGQRLYDASNHSASLIQSSIDRFPSFPLPFMREALTGLALGFTPIRIRVARERKFAAVFGNEVGSAANILVRRLGKSFRFGRHWDGCQSRS